MLSICKSFAIVLSVTAPHSVYVVSELSCTVIGCEQAANHVPLVQRFSIPVLVYPPPLCTFCTILLSLCALRSGHHMIPVQSKRICSIQRALKCVRHEFRLYLFTEVYYVTLHTYLSFVCVWRRCRQGRSAHPWINVPKWSKLQRISPAQGEGNNGHCVGSMSIGTQFMHRAHF